MKEKKCILIFSFILLVLILIIKIYRINNKIFSISIKKQEEINEIIKNRKETKENINLYYNNEIIPYIKNNNYYLINQKRSTNYNGIINCDNKYKIVITKPTKSKMKIIRENDYLNLIVYNKKNYKKIKLKMTYLPVVEIKESINYGSDKKAVMQINYKNSNKYNIKYHIRGGSSQSSEKKSYKFSLLGKNDSKKSVSLIDMRKDDDWILNSIYYDKSYIREKLCYDIWNNVSSIYQHNLEYVELIIDGEYQGLYYLQEPVDSKTFNKKKDDILVQVKMWQSDVHNRQLLNKNVEKIRQIDEFEFDKNDITDKKINTVKNLYLSINKNVNNIVYDIENNSDYNLFINLVFAVDNTYKNEKVYLKKVNNHYVVYKTAWDLDWTLSNSYQIAHFNVEKILQDHLINSDLINKVEYNNAIKSKYKKIRKIIYNEEYLNKMIDTYYNQLKDCGVIERNNKKWNLEANEEEVNLIRDFLKKRIKVLDKYYGDK